MFYLYRVLIYDINGKRMWGLVTFNNGFVGREKEGTAFVAVNKSVLLD